MFALHQCTNELVIYVLISVEFYRNFDVHGKNHKSFFVVYERLISLSAGSDKYTDPLSWEARVKIALGSARGLAYLHEDSQPRVIHRDFKGSNILLENDYTPKVSDFGLAKSASEGGKEHISTRVMGTFG